jgi:cysteine sulfinate desulfinase/cysteine desulfurase-like protein
LIIAGRIHGSSFPAKSPDPSHVLLATGLSVEEAHWVLKFSLGIEDTSKEIERTLELMHGGIKGSMEHVRFVSCK